MELESLAFLLRFSLIFLASGFLAAGDGCASGGRGGEEREGGREEEGGGGGGLFARFMLTKVLRAAALGHDLRRRGGLPLPRFFGGPGTVV